MANFCGDIIPITDEVQNAIRKIIHLNEPYNATLKKGGLLYQPQICDAVDICFEQEIVIEKVVGGTMETSKLDMDAKYDSGLRYDFSFPISSNTYTINCTPPINQFNDSQFNEDWAL